MVVSKRVVQNVPHCVEVKVVLEACRTPDLKQSRPAFIDRLTVAGLELVPDSSSPASQTDSQTARAECRCATTELGSTMSQGGQLLALGFVPAA